jgi:hypothetical protein
MAVAMESVLSKKQNYEYITPSPLNNLIDSSAFTIDFTNRKFLQVGLDPENNFNVSIHIITPSRHIAVSHDFLKMLFASMGDILSFILDRPVIYKRKVFLDTEESIVSTMVYRNEPVLVVESKTKHGHRILLNQNDLITIQSLEWTIYESSVRKSEIIRPMILRQVDQMGIYMKKRNNIPKNSDTKERLAYVVKNIVSDEEFIENIPKNEYCYISQIKTYATKQVVEKWISLMVEPHEVNTNILY